MPRRLTIRDFSDVELLHVLLDVADEEGFATTAAVAERINVEHDRPKSCVGARFSWLRRFGVLEREDGRWRLTESGSAMIRRQLSEREVGQIGGLDDDAMLGLTAALGARYRVTDYARANLIRRMWTHSARR